MDSDESDSDELEEFEDEEDEEEELEDDGSESGFGLGTVLRRGRTSSSSSCRASTELERASYTQKVDHITLQVYSFDRKVHMCHFQVYICTF